MNRETARECLTNGGRKTSEAEIDRFLEAVGNGTPVMPITFFCDALKTWSRLYSAPPPTGGDEDEIRHRQEIGEKASYVFTQIMKSNLLHRMLYQGEEPRKTPCPKHQGRWSGCRLPEESECKGACFSGINVTGWLP